MGENVINKRYAGQPYLLPLRRSSEMSIVGKGANWLKQR
jgi:hypothetical protein